VQNFSISIAAMLSRFSNRARSSSSAGGFGAVDLFQLQQELPKVADYKGDIGHTGRSKVWATGERDFDSAKRPWYVRGSRDAFVQAA
jgi:hypothetical protein